MTSVWIWEIDSASVGHVQDVFATPELMMDAMVEYMKSMFDGPDGLQPTDFGRWLDWWDQHMPERLIVWGEWLVVEEPLGPRTVMTGVAGNVQPPSSPSKSSRERSPQQLQGGVLSRNEGQSHG